MDVEILWTSGLFVFLLLIGGAITMAVELIRDYLDEWKERKDKKEDDTEDTRCEDPGRGREGSDKSNGTEEGRRGS